MPYQCVNCKELSRQPEIDCKCSPERRRTVAIQAVHLASEVGEGPTKIIYSGKTLSLMCSSTARPPLATPLVALVTCLDCRDKIKEIVARNTSQSSTQGTSQ